MQVWQAALLTIFVLLPFALMLDFWPNRERCDYNGRPFERKWRRQVDATAAHDASGHHAEH